MDPGSGGDSKAPRGGHLKEWNAIDEWRDSPEFRELDAKLDKFLREDAIMGRVKHFLI